MARFHALQFGALVLTAMLWVPSQAALAQSRSQAQTQTEVPLSSGCKLDHDLYTCDRSKFEQVLAAAKTAAIETGPVDPAGQDQLTRLITKLGKVVVPRGEADITFLLVPIDPMGVSYSTGDQQIATLRIFAKGEGAGRGNLVWAENYNGPVDLPWFAVANNVIGQFKSRFKIK